MSRLVIQIVDAIQDEESKANCASAIRLFERARAALVAGRAPEARDLAKQAVDLVPNLEEARPVSGMCHGMVALAHLQSGDHADALAAGSSAIEHLEGRPLFLNELAIALNTQGGAHLGAGDAVAAVDPFEQAIAIWRALPGSESRLSACTDNLRVARSQLVRGEVPPETSLPSLGGLFAEFVQVTKPALVVCGIGTIVAFASDIGTHARGIGVVTGLSGAIWMLLRARKAAIRR